MMSERAAPPMAAALEFVPLKAEHLIVLEPQASQRWQYGLPLDSIGWDEAGALAAQSNAWSVIGPDGRVLACLGINETFPGVQGVAWAFLSDGLGRAMVPITRFAAEVVIGASPLRRIEAIVRCRELPDWLAGDWAGGIASDLVAETALQWAVRHPTAQVNWARRTGLQPVAVLRAFGAASEAHMLLERII